MKKVLSFIDANWRAIVVFAWMVWISSVVLDARDNARRAFRAARAVVKTEAKASKPGANKRDVTSTHKNTSTPAAESRKKR
jgi:hypothetical protein